MVKNLYFDYTAIVLEIVLLSSILIRRMVNGRLNCVFVFLVTTALMTTWMDIFAVQFDGYGSGFFIEKYFFHSGYLLLRAYTSFFYMSYVIILTDTWIVAMNSKIKIITLFVPVLIVTVLMVLNLWTHSVYYIDENGIYTRGPLFLVLYVVNIYYIAYSVIKLILYRRYMEKQKLFSLLASFGVVIGAAGVQFFLPNILVDMFASAIALLLVFILVHRPEELIDAETGLLRTIAYARDMRQSIGPQGTGLDMALQTQREFPELCLPDIIKTGRRSLSHSQGETTKV